MLSLTPESASIASSTSFVWKQIASSIASATSAEEEVCVSPAERPRGERCVLSRLRPAGGVVVVFEFVLL